MDGLEKKLQWVKMVAEKELWFEEKTFGQLRLLKKYYWKITEDHQFLDNGR